MEKIAFRGSRFPWETALRSNVSEKSFGAGYDIDSKMVRPATRGQIYQSLAIRTENRQIEAFYHRIDQPGFGDMAVNQPADQYHIAMAFNAFEAPNLRGDGKSLGDTTYRPGTTHVFDHRLRWMADMSQPHATFNIGVPFWKLDELRYNYKSPSLEEFDSHFVIDYDPTMLGLATALLPAIQKPGEASTLFLEHMFSAISLHLAYACGLKRYSDLPRACGLAPWQEKRAKEMLENNLSGDISIDELAGACGLSNTYFARQFKNSTGIAPHRWLTKLRIEEAKELLVNSRQTLAEVAIDSGFTDQAHFTRVFTKSIGVSPGVWRRNHRS